MNDVKMPPIIGAAIRRITSEPAPVDHMMGTSPMNITPTVITLGRRRFTAPSSMASLRSVIDFIFPLAFLSSYARSKYKSMNTAVSASTPQKASPTPAAIPSSNEFGTIAATPQAAAGREAIKRMLEGGEGTGEQKGGLS